MKAFTVIDLDHIMKEFGKTGNFDYSFVCDAEGGYVLHFSNTDLLKYKLVTLDAFTPFFTALLRSLHQFD